MEFKIFLLTGCVLASLIRVLFNIYVVFITSCCVEQTVSTVFFLNWAVTDLIFILLLPLKVFFWNLAWVQRMSSTIISLHMFSSAFLLTGFIITHCILVAHPAWARNHCTPCLASWVSLGMWALSLGLSLWYSDHWDSMFLGLTIWDIFQLDERKLKGTTVIKFLTGFLIPLALILIPAFYIILVAKLKRNRLIESTMPLKLLFVLILTFFICWLPHHIVCFLLISHTYHAFDWTIGAIFGLVLTYFNSLINPIIYLTMKNKVLRYWQHAHNPQTGKNLGLEPDEMEH